jgi:tRNA (cytidine/uridine-2'-O-)-methyltransferase
MAEGFVIRDPQDWWGTERDTGLHLVLCQPEIPGNTGNIARLCAGADIWLHLVKPLGFELDNSYLQRAGLDYWPNVKLCVHDAFESVAARFPRQKLHLFTKRARTIYTDIDVEPGTVFVFGRETRGLDDALLRQYEDRLYRIPITDHVRSLNLANACSVVTYEGLRQLQWAPIENVSSKLEGS